ncbi:MAG: RIP metalloprotease RseP [Dehalococcoidia bacterium]|nr:RIP metalloprotease RseP [Dehalococcoidia bacterium]
MLTVVAFIGVILVLVFVHELGHFTAAKLSGVRVLEFALGFPPRLFQVRRGETVYTLNLLPLGGFVKMQGEEDPSDPRSLAAQPMGTRAVILSAGAFMNLALAIVLFSVVAMLPQRQLVGDVVVAGVAAGSPAAAARLQAGDVVRTVNEQRVENGADLEYQVQLRLGAKATFGVDRAGTRERIDVTPQWSSPADTQYPVTIGSVAAGAAGEAAGLQRGDAIVEANGQAVASLAALRAAVEQAAGAEISLLVERGRSQVATRVTPNLNPPEGQGPLGIVIAAANEATGVLYGLDNQHIASRGVAAWRAVPAGFRQAGETLVLMKNGITKWFLGDSNPRDDLLGPVGIARVTGEAASLGITPLLLLMAALSLNLAIMNVLPLPALDGGRLLFVAIEFVRRGKRIPPKKEALVHLAGFVTLMIAAGIITYFDISRIAEGRSAFGG